MPETIIVALITGGVTLTGNLLSNYATRKKEAIEQAKRNQKVDDQLHQLVKKIDEHNGYAKRFGEIEKAIVRIDTTLSERIKKM